MKYLILVSLLAVGCAKKQQYNCNCVSVISGQTLQDYDIEAKDYTEAAVECYRIQSVHANAGANTLDCKIR